MFNKLREKTGKQFVQKYFGGKPIRMGTAGEKIVGSDGITYECLGGTTWVQTSWGNVGVNETPSVIPQTTDILSFGSESSQLGQTTISTNSSGVQSTNSVTGDTTQVANWQSQSLPGSNVENTAGKWEQAGKVAGNLLSMQGPNHNASMQQTGMEAFSELGKYAAQNGGSLSGAMSSGAVTGAIGNFANAGLDKLEGALMGDKTFNAQSEAIDDVVRTTSQEMSKRFPPWGLLAAGVIETLNFVDKAAGKTVQGYEVGDAGSGFTGITTQQSDSTFRGSQTGQMKRDLARRQEQINMALAANNINEEESFMKSSRMNSVSNTLKANQIALAGGIDTSLLGG